MTRNLSFLVSLLVLTLAPSCTSTRAKSSVADATPASASFELEGSRIIACCCPTPCPCRLNKKPMSCHGCDHTDAVHIDRGQINGVRMDGVDYVVVGRGFGEDTSKNWTYVYVSDKATEEQFKALGDWLGAAVSGWGPKAKYLAGNFVGMRKAPVRYSVSSDGQQHDCTISGILDLRTHAITNPGHAQPVESTGILDAFGDRFVHADCQKHTYADATIGYEWDLTGRQCNQAAFVFDSERAARGGIGWGCWSAHADFGDREPYGEKLLHRDGDS